MYKSTNRHHMQCVGSERRFNIHRRHHLDNYLIHFLSCSHCHWSTNQNCNDVLPNKNISIFTKCHSSTTLFYSQTTTSWTYVTPHHEVMASTFLALWCEKFKYLSSSSNSLSQYVTSRDKLHLSLTYPYPRRESNDCHLHHEQLILTTVPIERPLWSM